MKKCFVALLLAGIMTTLLVGCNNMDEEDYTLLVPATSSTSLMWSDALSSITSQTTTAEKATENDESLAPSSTPTVTIVNVDIETVTTTTTKKLTEATAITKESTTTTTTTKNPTTTTQKQPATTTTTTTKKPATTTTTTKKQPTTTTTTTKKQTTSTTQTSAKENTKWTELGYTYAKDGKIKVVFKAREYNNQLQMSVEIHNNYTDTVNVSGNVNIIDTDGFAFPLNGYYSIGFNKWVSSGEKYRMDNEPYSVNIDGFETIKDIKGIGFDLYIHGVGPESYTITCN